MNNKIFLLLMLLSTTAGSLVFAQQKSVPGNVQEPFFWIKSRANNDAYYWESLTKTEAKVPTNTQKGTAFNFNPSIIFDTAQDSLVLPLGVNSKKKQTVFMVYKVKDSLKEQLLWTINDTKKTVSVATNKRLVDLKKYSYRSYNEKVKLQKANIHFFQQNITDTVAKPSTLTIGLKSKFEKLPPEEFNGNISEILVYNRVLSGVETQKVASYLAVKYGISLSQFEIKNYLNSSGMTIWDNDKHKGFQSSITAVGRDDVSGLLQLKSSNMAEEGLLTMELKSKTNKIPNDYFVFWSDNAKNLLVKKQEQGEPVGIDRQWQLDFAGTSDLNLDWTFDPKFIKGTLPKDTYYWLLVDHSGKGTYEENNSEYIKLGSTSSKEKLVLKDFNWDQQKSGSVKFTLKVAPQMFSRVWITQANCGVNASGELNYTIEGGEGPFTVTVKKQGTETILKQWSQTAKSSNGVKLSSGNYDYIVRDAKGNLYSETVFVADKQGTVPNLKSEYQLTNGNALTLDASLGLPTGNYEYEWYYEGNFIDNNPKILVDQPGNYELRLSNEQECKTSSKIAIATDGKENTDSSVLILYPNPTVDGHFTIAMQFATKTNATVSIYSPTGTLVQQKQFSQIENYIYDDVIKASSGMYLVTVNSDFGTKTFKVIVR
ncbi:T9SS type A sorting domain-containing protein [Flavobacterium sp. Fl-318]|uniref:T9SS type A sorting domain-containing protein n=1 Tax=Flavobacterium cupriresistens TaxID=2893885 RepID=A0ABU4R673_9FLAO|nr:MULTISPECIES: T9SS type A sorting domain-containing protein [unclassified Flavobacterium]MDX6188090.1 T9SS type A sorting domain-containing protein [Flavobacterium sp. Fl-318]UFH41990.1 T9SS type A sorting domain-containing protein [Flavobacterium sp. F-323]